MPNQENARDYIPLLEALADGELGWKTCVGVWVPFEYGCFDDRPENFRRRPKPPELKYVPFERGDEHLLRGQWVRNKNNPDTTTQIVTLYYTPHDFCVSLHGCSNWTATELLKNWELLTISPDGTESWGPCGKKVS